MSSSASELGTSTESASRGRTAREALADCRLLTLPPLRDAVGSLPERMAGIAGYHFGWLDDRGRPADLNGGKMLRPALSLVCAEAVGGEAADALPAAVAVELVHAFSLLHDDVIDGDRLRRHRPTVWVEFGVPLAVLAGDALLSLAQRVLATSGHSFAGKGMYVLCAAVEALLGGQAADVDFETRAEVAVEECMKMIAGKTGALMGAACALGALLGGGTAGQVERLREFGNRLGLAFQLVDDLLGIGGDGQITGKPVGADLVRRKRSLPVVFALASETAAGAELDRLYRLDRELTSVEVQRAATAVTATGGTAWVRHETERHISKALSCIDEAGLRPGSLTELEGFAQLVIHRDH